MPDRVGGQARDIRPPSYDVTDRLSALLSALSVESLYHLECALRAAETPGVGGTLGIEIPRRVGEHPRVKWVGGGTVTVEL